jgi:hypothetical protein
LEVELAYRRMKVLKKASFTSDVVDLKIKKCSKARRKCGTEA